MHSIRVFVCINMHSQPMLMLLTHVVSSLMIKATYDILEARPALLKFQLARR